MNDNDKEMIKEKLNLYFKLNTSIHIKLNNKEFRNGTISKIEDSYILLEEIKLGKIPILFSEIYQADKLRRKENDWRI